MREGQKKLFARRLRKQLTDTERELWVFLRSRRFVGYKFRRQVPIGPYIVDFCCPERRLIIELDGGQHLGQSEKDERRTVFLKRLNYRVLWFWDNQVFTQKEAVLEEILRGLPSPAPSPALAGEGKDK